jgi:hypothetical protein
MADEVHAVLEQLFPNEIIVTEYYVNYKGARLFFDFYLKDLGILFEIQGRQHFQFVKHFHGSIESFRAQKYRDNLKKEFIQQHKETCLVYFHDEKDKINKKLVLKRIYEAQHKEEGV